MTSYARWRDVSGYLHVATTEDGRLVWDLANGPTLSPGDTVELDGVKFTLSLPDPS